MPKLHKNVVVIDDDEVDIFFSVREIDKTDLFQEIYQFTDSRKALEFFKDRDVTDQNTPKSDNLPKEGKVIDLLLLDFRMPYLNGIEFLEALHANNLDHLIKKVAIMLTIPLMPDDEDRFRDADARVVFLDKPLDSDGLAAIVRA